MLDSPPSKKIQVDNKDNYPRVATIASFFSFLTTRVATICSKMRKCFFFVSHRKTHTIVLFPTFQRLESCDMDCYYFHQSCCLLSSTKSYVINVAASHPALAQIQCTLLVGASDSQSPLVTLTNPTTPQTLFKTGKMHQGFSSFVFGLGRSCEQVPNYGSVSFP